MGSVFSLLFYLVLAVLAFAITNTAQKHEKKYLLWIPIFLLALVAGLRDSTVGVDTANYLKMIPYHDRMELQAVDREYLFYYIAVGIFRIFGDVQPMFFFFGLLIYALIFFRIWDFRDTANLGIAAAMFTLFYFGGTMNTLRQYIALAIVFYMTRYLRQERYLMYFAGVTVAMLFHISAIVCLIFPVFYIGFHWKYTFRQILYLGCLVIGSIPAAYIFLSNYGSYLDDVKETDFGLMSVVRLIMLAGCYFLCSRHGTRLDAASCSRLNGTEEGAVYRPSKAGFIDDSSFRFVFIVALFGMILGLASAFIDFASRAGYYFRIFDIVFWGMVFQKKQMDLLLRLFLLFALAVLGAYSLWTYGGIIPYRTILG